MSRFRRSITILVSVALAAGLLTTAFATPASAAKKPRCQGKVATIVGTKRADVLKGSAKRDIIVAKGGADRIYGKGGNDLICAGTGNDLVVGGQGVDTLWGKGLGPVSTCERPVLAALPPPDTDGDGVAVVVDACPNEGDAGSGVDGTGYPFANGFHAKCVTGGGTYSEPVASEIRRDWEGPSPGGDVYSNCYVPLCYDLGAYGGRGDDLAPAYVECYFPI